MRISDWSSDVCSSDLTPIAVCRSSTSPPAGGFNSTETIFRTSMPPDLVVWTTLTILIVSLQFSAAGDDIEDKAEIFPAIAFIDCSLVQSSRLSSDRRYRRHILGGTLR